MLCCVSDLLVTLAAPHIPIVIPSVDTVLVSLIIEIEHSAMNTAVAAVVQVVVVVFNLKNFE